MTKVNFNSKDTFTVNNFTTISSSNGQISVGSNVIVNTSTIFVGNSSVNVVVNSSSISVGSLTVNSTGTTTNTFQVGTGSYFVANGNVGFGNSTPANKLSVNGTSYFQANTTFNSAILVNNIASNGTAYVSNGFYVTPGNWGVISANVTMDAANGNYQYATTNAAFTWTAPTTDCAIDILITNGSGAGTITFSGFTVQSGGTGDTYATTNGNKYLVSIRRINSTATYLIKALQ